MNEISIVTKEIPQEVITEATTAFQNGFAVLKPYLQALTTEDRKRLFKMSDGSEPFVSKTAEYAQTNAQFIPGYMDVKSMDTGLAVYDQLTPVCNLVAEINSLTCDTRIMAGAQALGEALNYYETVKTATKKRVAGAKAIFEELKKRFARKKSKKVMEAA